jgi:hypothetical protein
MFDPTKLVAPTRLTEADCRSVGYSGVATGRIRGTPLGECKNPANIATVKVNERVTSHCVREEDMAGSLGGYGLGR